jgi:hypothetical protein
MKQNKKYPAHARVFRPDRILRLATHLEMGNLYFPDKLEIKEIRIAEPELYEEHLELAAVPLYEMVYLFPKDWEFDGGGYPVFKGDKFKNPVSSAWKYLGINTYMIRHLFVPNHQDIKMFGGQMLNSFQSNHIIAHNLRELVRQEKVWQINRMYKSHLN